MYQSQFILPYLVKYFHPVQEEKLCGVQCYLTSTCNLAWRAANAWPRGLCLASRTTSLVLPTHSQSSSERLFRLLASSHGTVSAKNKQLCCHKEAAQCFASVISFNNTTHGAQLLLQIYRCIHCSVLMSSSQSCVLQAAINTDSLMRRRRCTADCRSCCSQVQHIIHRQPAISPTIAICAFHTCIQPPSPLGGVPVGILP